MSRIPAAQRRVQLVSAAIDVMVEDGVERASTHRIAAHAGVSQGIIHYAFDDKDALLEAVIEAVARRIRETLAESSGAPAASLAELLRAFWHHVEQTPDLQLLQYELTTHAVRDPEKSWLARRQYDEYLAIIESALGATGHDLDPETRRRRSRLVLAALDGLILQWIVFRDHDSASSAIEDLIGLVDLITG